MSISPAHKEMCTMAQVKLLIFCRMSFSHLLPITHCKVAGRAKTLVRDSNVRSQLSTLPFFAKSHIRPRSDPFPLPVSGSFCCLFEIGSEVSRTCRLHRLNLQRCIALSTSTSLKDSFVSVNPPLHFDL